jgi:hypothetical protein
MMFTNYYFLFKIHKSEANNGFLGAREETRGYPFNGREKFKSLKTLVDVRYSETIIWSYNIFIIEAPWELQMT